MACRQAEPPLDFGLFTSKVFGADGSPISVQSAANPGGSVETGTSNANQDASKVIDGNNGVAQGDAQTKWYDGNFATKGQSELVLTLSSSTYVTSYGLYRPWDTNKKRDPISWQFGIVRNR